MKQDIRDWLARPEEPRHVGTRRPLTALQIDDLVVAGSFHNAAGGIYATCIHSFARAIEITHGISDGELSEQQHG